MDKEWQLLVVMEGLGVSGECSCFSIDWAKVIFTQIMGVCIPFSRCMPTHITGHQESNAVKIVHGHSYNIKVSASGRAQTIC